MAIYRQVHVSFWQDAFVLELQPEEKYFYLYLMTNPHTNQCGIYELSKVLMSIELGYPAEKTSMLLQKFIDYKKILYSEETKEVFLVNWLKYNSLKSPKVMACVEKELQTVKNKQFLKLFCDKCVEYGYRIHTLSKDYGEEKEQKEQQEEKEKQQEEKRVIERRPGGKTVDNSDVYKNLF